MYVYVINLDDGLINLRKGQALTILYSTAPVIFLSI